MNFAIANTYQFVVIGGEIDQFLNQGGSGGNGKLLLDTMPYFKQMKEIAVDKGMQRMQWCDKTIG